MTPTVQQAAVTLADGRELIYFGTKADSEASQPDTRAMAAVRVTSEARYDPLVDEWVLITGHRMGRTHLPPDSECPLCPSSPGHPTEIPASSYEVVVFQNRFPALTSPDAGTAAGTAPLASADGTVPPAGADGTVPLPEEGDAATGGLGAGPAALLRRRPGLGRCEVVCFSPDHEASFADLTPGQAAIVLAAWTDRTAKLSRLPSVRQVYCFENRGTEIGVTLSHPHGQIYAYPFVTPRTSRMVSAARRYHEQTGGNVFDDILAAERADGSRVVATSQHWTAFVPHSARWPYQVHLYPHRRVPDLTELTEPEQAEFCEVYLDILRRFDRLFDTPAPYISAWHQAPVHEGRDELALHLELFTIRRAPGKLKYLAGTESGMDAFTNDIAPEDAARRLRQLA